MRPIARIFRRGVAWMSDLPKHAKLGGGSWGHAPPGNFLIRCSEIASEAMLGQKHSPCMHFTAYGSGDNR